MLASKPEKDIERLIVHPSAEVREDSGGVKINQLGIF
jgi:hypothetical protein